MSLVFSLLQRDFVVLAADNRHTRGDIHGTYIDDHGVKTLEIMNGDGVLGFAGEDIAEYIVSQAITDGILEVGGINNVAEELSKLARREYAEIAAEASKPPTVQILLSGWLRDHKGAHVATSYALDNRFHFSPTQLTYPLRKFEVIGKSRHGALYGLHRFGTDDLSLDGALRLSAFVLWEICKLDQTTGGNPQLYVLRPSQKVEKQSIAKINDLVEWAQCMSEQLKQGIMLSS